MRTFIQSSRPISSKSVILNTNIKEVLILFLLFRYNWQVREEWFELCKGLPTEELLRERVGGVGSIMQTMFHIVDVEYSWICALKGKSFDPQYDDYKSLDRIRDLSNGCRAELEEFLTNWSDEKERYVVRPSWLEEDTFTHGEVLRHIIAHEIHHIGQLSVWVREIGLQPVSPNFIGRELTLD
jgi:uncharacterized damage-inducible protein DinB